jgi:hypothetical protein
MEYAMKKKIAIIAIVAAMVTAGVYFGIGYAQAKILTVGRAYNIWEAEQESKGNLGTFAIWESEERIVANPGGSNLATLSIFNTRDKDRTFWISIEQANPNKLPDGYECLPAKYFNWFTPTGWDGEKVTAEPKVVVKAGQYRQISILVSIPLSTDYLNQPAEVRVRVTEIDSGSFQVNALESRWYIVIVPTPED